MRYSRAESNAIVPLGGRSVATAAINPKNETNTPTRQALTNSCLRLCACRAAMRTGRISSASIRRAPSNFIAKAMTSAMTITIAVWCSCTRMPKDWAISWSKKIALMLLKFSTTYMLSPTAMASKPKTSVIRKAKGLPQSSWRVSFAGTSKRCMTMEARAMVNTMAAALLTPKPAEESLVSLSMPKTNRRLSAMLTGSRGREKAREIAPPKITPCMSI